ncbi:16S rRNA (cytidine(1402)-2'-O)-methyltransferase [Pygmaiobacter massiliensis]|uniref:16S rRNA (cytidine(1402)-2'-O)-methyltransferase n=1 Tax=Pygmaiobacter massiliensis TaxID=1917873 RepID=UPI002A82E8B7|nr:16S rRNA (cytidine(1402)-2'-O)-methyltransferase [Pygmaiobacter massiliensis]MDY4785263.1 16S rRNA (cytidine(1402)-2'-O)-methyltransferase [Pygmaiobacter massiliensis]
MAGTLYIVATPIGNLSDMTPRAADTFAKADFIAAEDTRVTLKLLNHLGLKKPMVSYYEHNLKERGEMILRRVEAGESCAMCSDAGMPAVSDPGELLVHDALARGITVVPVPAASAAVTALAVSGQPTGRWCFEGFLPMNKRQRRERLEETRTEQRTMIFYEAPHKLPSTLTDMLAAYGDRSVTICRELTKLHEQIWKTTLAEAQAFYQENAPRGEFVLVLAGAEPEEPEEQTLDDAIDLAEALAAGGLAVSAACKEAAAKTGFPKSEIYRALTQRREN